MKQERLLCAVGCLIALMLVAGTAHCQAPQPPSGVPGPVPPGAPKPGTPTTIPVQPTQGQQPGAGGQAQPQEHKPPALEYAVAIVATLGILVIACMPSRKR